MESISSFFQLNLVRASQMKQHEQSDGCWIGIAHVTTLKLADSDTIVYEDFPEEGATISAECFNIRLAENRVLDVCEYHGIVKIILIPQAISSDIVAGVKLDTTSRSANGGLSYDVVGKNGKTLGKAIAVFAESTATSEVKSKWAAKIGVEKFNRRKN